jgi:general secretion pathway protein H
MGAMAAMARTVTSRTGSSERGNGYTLIELLVVLLILAAATSVALPRLESVLPQLKLKQTAREIVLALREAQRRAIQGGLQTAIRLDLAHRQLRGPGGLQVPLDPRFGLELTSAEGAMGPAPGEIDFFPDGTSTGGKLALAYGGRRYEVTVDWTLGRAVLSND